MNDLSTDITDYITNVIRGPTKSHEVITDIMRDAAHIPAWPKATYAEWQAAIETAIERGKLTRVSETIWIPTETASKKAIQGELF